MIRPVEMIRDTRTCLDCGMCEEIAAGTSWDADGVPVTALTLDAMAACPVGAIVWLEAEALERMQRARPVRSKK